MYECRNLRIKSGVFRIYGIARWSNCKSGNRTGIIARNTFVISFTRELIMTILIITAIGIQLMAQFFAIVIILAILDSQRGRGNSIIGKNRIIGSRDYRPHARTNTIRS